METSSCDDGAFASRIAASKSLTKTALRALGLPTPMAIAIKDISELEQALSTVCLPCVTKPIDGSQGKGVSTDLRTLAARVMVSRWLSRLPAGPCWLKHIY